MIHTIRVKTAIGPDLLGHSVFASAQEKVGKKKLDHIETAKVYRVEGSTEKEAKILAEKLFSESINQEYTINSPVLKRHSGNAQNLHTIEIAYKPGVMNPEVASIVKAAMDMGIILKAADTSLEYGFFGSINKKETKELVNKLSLLNPLIEHIVTITPKTLIMKGKTGKTATIPLRKMSDKQLVKLSKDTLYLNLEEMQAMQHYFVGLGRDPKDIEIETIAQTWSEHCAHKTFKTSLVVDGKKKEPLMTRIKKEALKHKKHIVSAFVDNAGAMDFYDGYAICAKAETHNSPSAIEPYGGAATGSGGCFRDVVATGQGAQVIAASDIFCFAPLDMDLRKLPTGTLSPKYLLKRVVTGVKDYGNRVGIPTINGSVHFHEDFRAKPTVLVGAYGFLPKKRAKKGVPHIGDLIIILGGKTGRDGIHGATFSSAQMSNQTQDTHASAVQIGNAIEEKRTFDAILEARDRGLLRAVQDLGAGGFSSALGELGESTGLTIHLEKAPLKYPGLNPWEIWVSESQERMALAIPKRFLKNILQICKKYNVGASILGEFDDSKKLQIFYEKEKICDLDMNFLHDGLPKRIMIATKTKNKELRTKNKKASKEPENEQEWIDVLQKVLADGNVASKEPIVRLYDHSVQGRSAMQPFLGRYADGPSDAAIVKPFYDKQYGMMISHGLNPILNRIDPYYGSLWASVEALSNYVASGGDYTKASLINNYIWPVPDETQLWSLDKCVDAVVDIMKTFKIPVISGKDSLSSTFKDKSGHVIQIPPVLCMSVFGKIKDVTKTVSTDFKQVGSTLYLIGNPDFAGMGGSVYYQTSHTKLAEETPIPHVTLKKLPKILTRLHEVMQEKAILSCHDISEGGMITTLFEMCVGGNMGATIDLSVIASEMKQSRPDNILFNETAGCFIVEVQHSTIAEKLFKGIPFLQLGRTKKEKNIAIKQSGNQLFTADLEELKNVWKEPMQKIFT